MAKIVIVEDNSEVTRFLSEVLTSQGHQVVTSDEAHAFSQVQRERPDIAVLDLTVWRAAGSQFVEQVRSDKLTCDTTVLVWAVTAEQLRSQLAALLGEDIIADEQHGLFDWADERYSLAAELKQHISELVERINQALPPARLPAPDVDLPIPANADLRQLLSGGWLEQAALTSLIEQLTSFCALEVAALYAVQPTMLLRPSELALLGYHFGEAQAAMFDLARLGLLEPLAAIEDTEFGLPVGAAQHDLLCQLDAAMQEPELRREMAYQVLRQERAQLT